MARMTAGARRHSTDLEQQSVRLLVAGIWLALYASAASADEADRPVAVSSESASARVEEIIVTARKREEVITDAPVAIYALSSESLDTYAVNDIVSASKLTPGLLISRSTNNGAAQIYLRGVGSSFSSPSFDQAVGINIDNVAISKGRAIFQSFFDMQQMEVLRGPQALFFGKNSTAGVVSIRTADPGDETEFLVRAGYEFEGEQYIGEFVGSGPVSDSLALRVALRATSMKGGFFENVGASLNGVPRNSDTPEEDELGGRITLVTSPQMRSI